MLFQSIINILFFLGSFSLLTNALPLEQQDWDNFPSSSPPYDETQLIGGRMVRVEVSAGMDLDNVGPTNGAGDILNQPTGTVTNPNDLPWISVSGGDPENYTVVFTATSLFLEIGDAFIINEPNGDVPNGPASSIAITQVTDINDNVIVSPTFDQIFEEITGDRISPMSLTGNIVTLDTPFPERRGGALYLINTNSVAIKSISLEVTVPVLADTSEEFIRFGMGINQASPFCGNFTIEVPEECDDGNLVNGDGCNDSCMIEACGNGVVDVGEQCDDGNTVSGDGCSATCMTEGTVCGNSVVEAGEQCDDGNTLNGDGCNASCQNEPAMLNVNIDIVPGREPNCVKINDNQVVRVAILGSPVLDVSRIDASTLIFAGLVPEPGPDCAIADVAGPFGTSADGFLDLVCRFTDVSANFMAPGKIGTLTGMLQGGFTSIMGSGTVCLLP